MKKADTKEKIKKEAEVFDAVEEEPKLRFEAEAAQLFRAVKEYASASVRVFSGFGERLLSRWSDMISAELLDFLFSLFARHHYVAFFILSKFIEKVFVCYSLAIFLFCSKLFGNCEGGHDGGIVDAVEFHFVAYFHGVGERFGVFGEQLVHLLARLHPLLLGVEHTGGVVEVLARGEADEAVVCLGMLFVDKVHVVGAHQPDAIFLAVFDELLVHLQLQFVRLVIGTCYGSLV